MRVVWLVLLVGTRDDEMFWTAQTLTTKPGNSTTPRAPSNNLYLL
jgi:hypothetical protein